jgi:hypothetical protein
MEYPVQIDEVSVHVWERETTPQQRRLHEQLGREIGRKRVNGQACVDFYITETAYMYPVLWREGRVFAWLDPAMVGAGAEYRVGPLDHCTYVA